MSTQIAESTTTKEAFRLNRLGAVVILGSVLQFIAAVGIENRSGEFSPPWAHLLFLIGSLCLMAGPLGIRMMGVKGRSKLGLVGVVMTLLGQVSWAIGMFTFLMGWVNEWHQEFTPIGAMLNALGMLVIGIAVLRAHVWTDWRRFTPLIIPAYFFLVNLPGQIIVFFPINDNPSFYLLGTWYLTWIVVGYALWSSTDTDRLF